MIIHYPFCYLKQKTGSRVRYKNPVNRATITRTWNVTGAVQMVLVMPVPRPTDAWLALLAQTRLCLVLLERHLTSLSPPKPLTNQR